MNSPSNSNSAATGRLSGTMLGTLTKWLRGSVDDMLPAKVISYDPVEGRATIQPIIMLGTTDGIKVSRAAIEDVPVYRFGGGGLVVSTPLNEGDLGWLKASDRDISLFKQHGLEDWPNTERLHSFEDAMFFPDAMRNVVLGDSNALCIQTIDGLSGIFITPDGIITIKTPDSSLVINGGGATLTAGNYRISAESIDFESGTLTHNGVNIGDTHTHIGPETAPNGPVVPTGTPI